MCVRVLQEHVDSIEECGGLPFDILQPILDRATPQTLFRIEQYNTYLIEDTTELWERHCKRHFPKKQREEMETWRDLFERCTDERERKLEGLKSKLQNSYAKERDAQKKTKLAYVGLNAKPPRNVRAAQARNGTAGSTAVANVKRLAAAPIPVAAGPPQKPTLAPLRAKTPTMARGMQGSSR